MLLAFDTATSGVTVALHDGERVVATHDSDEAMRHGELLGPGIAAVLRQVDAMASDVTAVAVGAGPGPYTGLRVGLVTARTMAHALQIPVYAVCTLDILAVAGVDLGLDEFLVATDARRKEVYFARYVDGLRVEGPVVAKPGDLFGDGVADLPALGRGAALYPDTFVNRVGPELPSATALCDAVVDERFELLDPEPLYLRRPDVMAPRPPKPVS